MKEQVFKLFELPTHQVLFTKDFDNKDDEDTHLVTCTIFLDGVKTEQKLGFTHEDEQIEYFNSLTIETAEQFLKSVLDLFANGAD